MQLLVYILEHLGKLLLEVYIVREDFLSEVVLVGKLAIELVLYDQLKLAKSLVF